MHKHLGFGLADVHVVVANHVVPVIARCKAEKHHTENEHDRLIGLHHDSYSAEVSARYALDSRSLYERSENISGSACN